MSNVRVWWGITGVLLIIIVVLAWILFATPAPVQAPTIPDTGNEQPAPTPPEGNGAQNPSQPLHERVVVSSPLSGATVSHTLVIEGQAPGNWYFEASFPIKVITEDGDTIGSGHADALGDWMTTDQVPFKATINLTLSYSGPATLALLKDNPSGLPENDDSLEIPIVVQ